MAQRPLAKVLACGAILTAKSLEHAAGDVLSVVVARPAQ